MGTEWKTKLDEREANSTPTNRTDKLLDEYRSRIGEAIESEWNRLREVAEEESRNLIARAREESASITEKSRQEARQLLLEAREKAPREAEAIIAGAQQRAAEVISSAEERAKKEAREKTKNEMESLLREAKEEAGKIVTRARQVARDEAREEAKRESAGLVAEARQKSGQLISEAKDKTLREREQVLASIISEARRKSETEANQIIGDAKQKAERMLNETRSRMRLALQESVRLVMDAHLKLGEALGVAERETKRLERAAEAMPVAVSQGEHNLNSILPAGRDDDSFYQGRLQLDIAPPIDLRQLSTLESHLRQIPQLRLVARGGSTGGRVWVEVEVSKPFPLVKALRDMPLIKEVIGYKDNIIVALKPRPSEVTGS
ncbi:MAG: hypothetical protein V1849_02990 [Chloroflexota bacterium]